MKCLFVFQENYFLTVFLLFMLPKINQLIKFLIVKIFESHEQYLIIKFPVCYGIYQYATYQFTCTVKFLPLCILE